MSDDDDAVVLLPQAQDGGAGDWPAPNTERMGPYATREEAEGAIAHAAERTEDWDNDPRWKDD